jgi:hypothetical protein
MMRFKPFRKFSGIQLSASLIILMSGFVNCHAALLGVVHDNYTLDVFRTSQITAEQIDKKFTKEFTTVASVMLSPIGVEDMQKDKTFNNSITTIMTGIQGSGKYAYVGLSPITYPGGKKISFTVDIVDPKEKSRMAGMLPKPKGSPADPQHLIANWMKYDKYSFDTFYRTKKAIPFKSCPAFHCSFGFDDPKLKPYGDKFNAEVPKYKEELVAVLRTDKEENKRGAAAYLLAHLKNGNEVIQILVPSIRDSSSQVRNSVMRVLAQTVLKVEDNNFPVDEIIRALRFPATVDRNKALYVLESLSTKPFYANYIKTHACYELIDQLMLIQPNLHSNAYGVLKKVSQKNYSETDITVWQDWAAKTCPKQKTS